MKLDFNTIINDRKNVIIEGLIHNIVFIIIFLIIIFIFYPKGYSFFPFVLIIFCVIFGIIPNIKELIYLNNETNKLSKIIQEYLDNTIFYSEGNYIITDKCIIEFDRIVKIIRYEDIVLIYKKKNWERHNIMPNDVLFIILKNKKEYWFYTKLRGVRSGDIETIDFSNIILEKNPNVLVGKTKENKQILLEKYGIKL